MTKLGSYLKDPLLKGMYDAIRAVGPVRSIALDITSKCNLRCSGCYYYAEGMDQVPISQGDCAFDALLRSEKERGTNFITVVGGEPALVPGRLKKIYASFKRVWCGTKRNRPHDRALSRQVVYDALFQSDRHVWPPVRRIMGL